MSEPLAPDIGGCGTYRRLAVRLWAGLLLTRHLTDGRIPKDAVPLLSQLKRRRKDVVSLLKAGLWHDEKDHYQQHDYCVIQRIASSAAAIR